MRLGDKSDLLSWIGYGVQGEDFYFIRRGCYFASIKYRHGSFLRAVSADPNEDISCEDVASYGCEIADAAKDNVSLFKIIYGTIVRRQVGKLVQIDGCMRGIVHIETHLGHAQH